MQLTQIRNATLILDYAGQRLLIDPFFGEKHAYPSFTGASQNPTVDLPMPIEQIIDGVTGIIVTHLHNDHFDAPAREALNKSLPLFCQPGNEAKITEYGFTDVTPVTEAGHTWNGITITRIGGHHGIGAVENLMGMVSGFVFQAADEPTVYLTGDTVLCGEVREAISVHQPDVIISNSGGAMWADPENDSQRVYILFDEAETVELARLASGARVVITHIEALDHCTVTRASMRSAADDAGIPAERLLIPVDGETVTL